MPDQKPWERYGASNATPAKNSMAQTARDEAGNIWEVDAAGNAVRLVQPAGGGQQQGQIFDAPVDPYAIPKDAAQLDNTRANADRVRAELPYVGNKAEADARRAQNEADKSGFDLSGARASRDFERADKLRADYEALPSVKNYTQALPVFGAGLRSSPNPAGDLNLIYAYAKVMDPNSVVREGEQASVANADTWVNAKVAQLQKQLGRGGTFKPEFRKNLRDEMAGRMGELNQSFIGDRVRYKQIADRYEIDPLDVVGNHPGERFQGLSKQVLGRDQMRLDYQGQPIPHSVAPRMSGPGGGRPTAAADGPRGSSPTSSSTIYGNRGSGATATLATGDTKSESDPRLAGLNGRVAGLLQNRSSDASIRDFIAKSGAPVDASSVEAVLDFRRKNPGYKGAYPVDIETRTVPTTAWNRFASSPTGTGIYAAVDAGMGGLTDEIASAAGGGDLADLNARKQAAFAANPKAAFAGQVVGTAGSMAGLGALGRTAGLGAKIANPQLAGDIAFGAFSGAGQNNDNRILGATLGAGGGAGGNYVGQGVARAVGALNRSQTATALVDRARGMFGRGPIARAERPTPAQEAAYGALNRAGADDVAASLGEAQSLGIPMSLADTNPNLRELAGAAVRRSPSASSYAEDALIPRNRGQYDRFTGAVERNLGPTTNIPQRSAEMMGQARTAASDLYDKAYSSPVPNTPELDSVLGTPFGRQALGRAKTIAANERRSPSELGFAQDADGNVVLNPRPNETIARHLSARDQLDQAQEAYRAARTSPNANVAAARDRVLQARDNLRAAEQTAGAAPDPSMPASVPGYTTQTLDYVKRGMDDVLEEQRNPITGRLALDEAGRAQNGVRGQLLGEVDRLNPDYAAARSAYAGPAASRDALARGGDAYGLHPDELGMQVSNQAPEHLAQMQLGYRGAMTDHAGRVRDSSNPWDATLGSPVARDRLSTMYPGNPGVDRMLRSVDMEKQLQQTTNAVLGNSRTARNQLADQAFAGSPLVEGALHAGAAVATHGASLPGTAARIAGTGIRDRLALGFGKRAEAKADALAPILLNPNPVAAQETARQLLAQQEAWQRLVVSSRPKGLGMFGSAIGSQAAAVPFNY